MSYLDDYHHLNATVAAVQEAADRRRTIELARLMTDTPLALADALAPHLLAADPLAPSPAVRALEELDRYQRMTAPLPPGW